MPRLCLRFTPTLDIRLPFRWVYGYCAPSTFPANICYRPEPLHSESITPPSSLLWAHVRVLRPPFPFAFAYRNGPCRLDHPRLVRSTFPAFARCSFLKRCVPYPGSLSSALIRFFLDNIGLATYLRCSAVFLYTTANGSHGESITGRQTFLYLAALQFVRPPGRSHR